MNTTTTNPRQLLKEKAQEKWSGCLLISEPKDPSVNWQIYLKEGKLEYGTSAVGQRERLTYLWQELQSNLTMPEFTSQASEYENLYNCLVTNKLPASLLKQLIFQLTQEALIQILSFEEISIKSFPDRCLAKPIISYSWLELAQPKDETINKWRELRSLLDSTFSRLYLDQKNSYQFYKYWKNLDQNSELEILLKSQKVSTWMEKLSKKLCFYEFAAQCAMDTLTIVKILQPLLEKELIQVLPFQEFKPQSPSIASTPVVTSSSIDNIQTIKPQPPVKTNADLCPLVVCIDDSKTVQRQVKMILESVGYQVLGITDPRNALTTLKGEDPVMILMDINMPNINGYELCSMLRRSNKFQDIPVVMLTGRDGIVDRIRANFVGANNYLTKPCKPNDLIGIVQQIV